MWQWLWKKSPPPPPVRVRWIETRGCMADDYKIEEGTVVREYIQPADPNRGFNKPEPFLEVRLDSGTGIYFPKAAFTRHSDGWLEYRF